MMISLLLPSRGRPDNLTRMSESAVARADRPDELEIIVFIDNDDDAYSGHLFLPQVQIFSTERTVLSKYWNMAYEESTGDILMHCGDDIVFQTPSWDTKVREAFDRFPDQIALVFGDDGDPTHANFGTHSFIHRRWAETVGYFVPPYFSSDYNDTWLNEVADMIGRKVRVDILTEHMHFALGKGPLDLTHAERLVRHHKDNTTQTYEDTASERAGDADKLRAIMT